MTGRIRRATLRDAEAIRRVHRDALGYDYPMADVVDALCQSMDRSHEAVFVAVTETGVAGCLHAAFYDTLYAPPSVNILGLAVLEEARGRGLGRALLAAAEEWAKENGRPRVRLESGFDRTEAHAFYLHCGYEGGKDHKHFMKELS